jgi:hypothetical protein
MQRISISLSQNQPVLITGSRDSGARDYVFDISNKGFRGVIEIEMYPSEIIEWANLLTSFPKATEDKCHVKFMFRDTIQFETTVSGFQGECETKVVINCTDNDGYGPRGTATILIYCMPAELNDLGRSLVKWASGPAQEPFVWAHD